MEQINRMNASQLFCLCVMALILVPIGMLLVAGCGDVGVPSAPPPPLSVRPLALGSESSCALSDGIVRCWGEGDGGQLGDGLASDRLFPLPVAFNAVDAGFTALALGRNHSCALRFTGVLYCWGEGLSGALGSGGLVSVFQPLAIDSFGGESRKVRLFDTGRYHSCAVTEENDLYCWGYSGNGQIGTGDVDGEGEAPSVLVPKLVQTAVQGTGDEAKKKPITSIATGGYHSCLTYSDGNAACWGYSEYGQLGNGCIFGSLGDNLCTTDRTTPMTVPYFDGSTSRRHAKQIFTGAHHSCVVNANGELFCFGRGDDGQLGVNKIGFSHSIPRHVGNTPAPIRALALGDAHGCVLFTTGKVYCFGDNQHGQLGNQSTVDSAIPVRVSLEPSGDASLVGIATGATHSCAWDDRGQYYCWGRNTNGQLGLGVQGGSNAYPEQGVY